MRWIQGCGTFNYSKEMIKMKALVLGMGLQGKAVVHDLEQSP